MLLLSMGFSLAKTDVNSHQLISNPGPYAEVVALYQPKEKGHVGFKLSFNQNVLETRTSLLDDFSPEQSISNVNAGVFFGTNFRFIAKTNLYLSAGASVATSGDWAIGPNFMLTRRKQLKGSRRYYWYVASGISYWPDDVLDNYADQTDRQGDITFNLSVGIGLPN